MREGVEWGGGLAIAVTMLWWQGGLSRSPERPAASTAYADAAITLLADIRRRQQSEGGSASVTADALRYVSPADIEPQAASAPPIGARPNLPMSGMAPVLPLPYPGAGTDGAIVPSAGNSRYDGVAALPPSGPAITAESFEAAPVLTRAGPGQFSGANGDTYTQAGPHGVINNRTGGFSPTN